MGAFRDVWKGLMDAPPGARFERHFRRREGSPRGLFRRVFFIGGGLLLAGAGLFMIVAPGPGVLAFFVGAALIAQESRLAARALDRGEVRVRALSGWALETWRGAPARSKAGLVSLGVLLSGAALVLAYELLLA